MPSASRNPDLQGVRRFALAIRDAHGLYRQFGFTPIAKPERFMKRLDAEIYSRETAES